MKILIYLSLFFVSLFSFRGKTIYEGKENHIYLTFDDGYSRNNTIKILDILDEYDIPATFFLEGGFMKDNQDVVKRISDEQIVGNHIKISSGERRNGCPFCANESRKIKRNTLENNKIRKYPQWFIDDLYNEEDK